MQTSATPWHAIGDLARLAPTPHNTQPYRIRPCGPLEAELVLVCDRLLPKEDRGNAYVLSAFGVFAATLEHAGRAHGHAVTVEPVADLDGDLLHCGSGERVVGMARLEPGPADVDVAPLLALRRTSRLPYHEREVAPGALAWFGTIAEQAGHTWTTTADAVTVGRVLRMNAEAIVDNLQDKQEREEIRGWYRLGKTPAFGDGLWEQPMQQLGWQLRAAFRAPWLFAIEPMRSLAIARYVRMQGGTRHVAALGGPFDTWPERVAAGRMLFEVWLAMADAGVYMQPFGSMLTNPRYAARVESELGIAKPWLVMRVGYSDPPPVAPRLPSIVLA